jgi:transposase
VKKYSGIDLHSNNSVVGIIDESGRCLYCKRLPNELARVLEVMEPHRGELVAIAVESTYNWYWLVDGLQGAGYEVRLAHVAAMARYSGRKRRDDETDALELAQRLRLGDLPTGYICPREEREVRDLARRRLQLVRHRTMHVLAFENVQARETGTRMTGDKVKQLDAQGVELLGLPADVTLGMQANVAVIRALNGEIAKLERHILERVRPRAEYRLLNTVPGIARVLAPIIMLEAGGMERFKAVGNFASYARCVDSEYTSNNKKKGEGNRRNGNKYLAWAFIEAANMAKRWCPQAKRFHDRKRARTNAIVATKALAHKLARASYYVLKRREPFDMKRCFG